MRKRLALALRLMANRLDPVPASNFVITNGFQITANRFTTASPGITFTAGNGGPLPA